MKISAKTKEYIGSIGKIYKPAHYGCIMHKKNCKLNKKSQIAVHSVMTYGWAVIAVLTAISAVVQFMLP